MKQLKKTALILLLTLCMALGVMPAMGQTAFAYAGNPYADLVNTTTAVKFNDKD